MSTATGSITDTKLLLDLLIGKVNDIVGYFTELIETDSSLSDHKGIIIYHFKDTSCPTNAFPTFSSLNDLKLSMTNKLYKSSRAMRKMGCQQLWLG